MLKSGAEGNDWETLSDGYGNVSENKRGGDRFQLFRNRLQGLNVLGGDTSEGNGASLGGQGCDERSQDWVLEDLNHVQKFVQIVFEQTMDMFKLSIFQSLCV